MLKKILIIDDDKFILKKWGELLSKDGFSVIKAENGEEGLNIALKERPALILLDIAMPKMDGITMLCKLREDEWGKNTQVIMLTNLIDTEKISRAMEKGAFDYFIKSDISMEDVMNRVKAKIDKM